jgi:hypothetical protein
MKILVYLPDLPNKAGYWSVWFEGRVPESVFFGPKKIQVTRKLKVVPGVQYAWLGEATPKSVLPALEDPNEP